MEVTSQNSLGFCRMGGMRALLMLIITHQNVKVRKPACQLFCTIIANNKTMQEFAMRLGAVNLSGQLDRE